MVFASVSAEASASKTSRPGPTASTIGVDGEADAVDRDRLAESDGITRGTSRAAPQERAGRPGRAATRRTSVPLHSTRPVNIPCLGSEGLFERQKRLESEKVMRSRLCTPDRPSETSLVSSYPVTQDRCPPGPSSTQWLAPIVPTCRLLLVRPVPATRRNPTWPSLIRLETWVGFAPARTPKKIVGGLSIRRYLGRLPVKETRTCTTSS